MAKTPAKRAKSPVKRAGANTEGDDAEPSPTKRPKPTDKPRRLCRVSVASSPFLGLCRALMRLAENRFIVFSGEGPEKTTMRIISQVFNGEKRKTPGFKTKLKDAHEGWGYDFAQVPQEEQRRRPPPRPQAVVLHLPVQDQGTVAAM